MKLTTNRIPGLVLTDHEFTMPLHHQQPDGQTISVYAREVVALEKEKSNLPWLVFLQGGPGYSSPRPTSKSGWLKRALQDYRVLLLDQRGTGRSTPMTYQTLAQFSSPQAQADYLKHFRADAIVQDCERIRQELAGEPWSVLGQSFGGFCAVHYLSAAPEGLREVFITGGLPPLNLAADDVYRATYQRVLGKNRRYYERYPADVKQVRQIVDYLQKHEVRLPGGDLLTPRRFQQLGGFFGASDGFESVHYMLEEAFVPGAAVPTLNYLFLRGLENSQTFDSNPIYALLHEPIYCQMQPANWSAERIRAEFPLFDAYANQLLGNEMIYFTGEMIYPWMFDEFRFLKPLKETAQLLAEYEHWPVLYNEDRLRQNNVPVAAAVYHDDMYVECAFSEETARTVKGLRAWITNEYEHNALRADGEHLLDRLIKMAHGEL